MAQRGVEHQSSEKKQELFKLFKDPVHGSFELPLQCVAIIDTPEFQRLRHIKQLGAVDYVYPGASHSRFEHSLGVCHLAGEFLRLLIRNQPELNDITPEDIICVQIAGLCHNLGHGPMSKVFEFKFMKPDWRHEDLSVVMFKYMLESNPKLKESLIKEYEQNGKKVQLKDEDITFIRNLIGQSKYRPLVEPHFIREAFLYKIVANVDNSIDVRTWDYLARDCHYLGIKNNFDYKRLMHFGRVNLTPGNVYRSEIMWRDTEVDTLYNMFYMRWRLHKIAYKHKTSSIIETMYAEALEKVDTVWHELLRDRRGPTATANNDLLPPTATANNDLLPPTATLR